MPVIENNRQQRQYQLFEDGELAGFVQYRMRGSELWILYTQMTRRFRDLTLTAALLHHVLEDARRSRLAILPFCPAIRSFMASHPQYDSLIPPEQLERFAHHPAGDHREEVVSPVELTRPVGSRRARRPSHP